jgi:hypothetical protein
VTSAESVGKMLGSMIQQHEPFCSPHAHAQSPTQ